MLIVSALLAVGLTAPASAAAPDAPTNLSSSRGNNTTVTLSWSRVAGASSYDVTVGNGDGAHRQQRLRPHQDHPRFGHLLAGAGCQLDQ